MKERVGCNWTFPEKRFLGGVPKEEIDLQKPVQARNGALLRSQLRVREVARAGGRKRKLAEEAYLLPRHFEPPTKSEI